MNPGWAITGLGVIAPTSTGPGTLGMTLRPSGPLSDRALVDGKPTGGLHIHFQPEAHLEPGVTRRMDPLSARALVCARWALGDAALRAHPRLSPDTGTGVAFGTAFGCQTTSLRYAKKLCEQGGSFPNPIDFPDSIDGAPASHIAVECALGGPSVTVPDGELAGEMALLCAVSALNRGRAERMVVVAGDELTPALTGILQDLEALGSRRAAPEQGTRVIPSESMAALVLEDGKLAERRGARIYAWLAGFGVAVEPSRGRPSYPRQPATHLHAVDRALHRAELGRADVSWFSGASCGIPELDLGETEVVRILRDTSPDLKTLALRSLTGYCPSDGVLRVGFCAAELPDSGPAAVVVHHGAARSGQCISWVLRRP